MKVAFIAPINNLNLCRFGDIHMALTQFVLTYPQYRDFYASETKFKILDNGAFEGELRLLEDVLEAAKQIKANEVVLPDIVGNGQKTIQAIHKALQQMKTSELESYQFMGVVQGATPSEWWECFAELHKIPEIDTIGLSKLSCPRAFNKGISQARLDITREIAKQKLWGNKQYHLLGGSNNIIDEIMMQDSHIRSIDTGAPVEYGKARQRLIKRPPLSLKRFDFEESLKDYNIRYVENNIKDVFAAAGAHSARVRGAQ